MKVLVPVDGSDCSLRALDFATEFARRFDADLDIVHFTDIRGEDTEELLNRVEETLEEAGIESDVSVSTDVRLGDFKSSSRVGKNILSTLKDDGYDHVVMGHHGDGRVEKFLLGSAAETVLKSCEIPVTTVP
ncbi:universal stress protein [Haladaptatus sp. NG-WS-4]